MQRNNFKGVIFLKNIVRKAFPQNLRSVLKLLVFSKEKCAQVVSVFKGEEVVSVFKGVFMSVMIN